MRAVHSLEGRDMARRAANRVEASISPWSALWLLTPSSRQCRLACVASILLRTELPFGQWCTGTVC